MPSSDRRAQRIFVCAALFVSATAALALHAQSVDPFDELISRMTLDEKLSMLQGAADPASIGQLAYLPGVPRLNIPPLRVSEGSAGLQTAQPATAMPAPIALAATFSM